MANGCYQKGKYNVALKKCSEEYTEYMSGLVQSCALVEHAVKQPKYSSLSIFWQVSFFQKKTGVPSCPLPFCIKTMTVLLLFHVVTAFLVACRSDCDRGSECLDFQCHEPHLAYWHLHLCSGLGSGHRRHRRHCLGQPMSTSLLCLPPCFASLTSSLGCIHSTVVMSLLR